MGVILLKCPECGGELQMDDSLEQGFCQYCGNKIAIKKDNVQNVTNNVTNNNISNSNVTIVTNDKDFEIKAGVLIKYNGESEIVNIPNKVKKIGSGAFEKLGVTKVIVPDSVLELERGCFAYCDLLEEINLPQNLKTIARDTFKACTSLKEVKFPENLEKLSYMHLVIVVQ